MKISRAIFLTALAGAIALTPDGGRADGAVSVGVDIHATADFDAPLRAHGSWVEVGSYGHCWHPTGIEAGWRPYCVGQWEWTDCGWYWESDEPWAWACYHYGSWVEDPAAGWVWIPAVEWSPAWVTWRSGGGYIGWAPFGPPGVVVRPGLFAFVEVGHFHEPIRRNTIVVNNTTIINKTTVINGTRQENRDIGAGHAQKVVVHDGPNVAEVEKATGKKFTPAPIATVAKRAAVPAAAPKNTTAPDKARESTPLPAPKPSATPVKPETTPKPAPTPKPEVTPKAETPARPETSEKKETPAKPVTPEKSEAPVKSETVKPETPVKPSTPAPSGAEKKAAPREATPSSSRPAESSRPAGGEEKKSHSDGPR